MSAAALALVWASDSAAPPSDVPDLLAAAAGSSLEGYEYHLH